jgi:hypothetical protein
VNLLQRFRAWRADRRMRADAEVLRRVLTPSELAVLRSFRSLRAEANFPKLEPVLKANDNDQR